MESLKKKLQYAFNSFDKKEISDYLSKMRPDGSFTDVNYKDQSRGEWLTYQHLRRAAELSCAYVEDPSLKDAVLSAVHFWYLKDYRNPNWWYNDLGVPQKLRIILLNCDHLLDEELRERMIERLQTDIEPRWTGMNKLWFAENLLFRGVITGDIELIQKASREIADTIFISQEGKEGVQVDASFAQHGMQLYNHGYGRDFLIKSALWLELLHDTPYALPSEKVKILTELYLQGTARMGRFHSMDYSAQSREIVRCYREKNLQAGMQLYIPAARNLIKCNTDPMIRKQLADTIEFIEGKRPNPYEESNTAHWVLKFMTHQRNGYYVSVRMASKEVYGGDTNGIEIVNGENALGGFGAYGLCVYMRDGHEYEKIFPVMDWGCMPGTTTPDVELPLELGGVHESEFVGNISDGLYGLSAMDQNKTFTYDGETVTFGGRFAYFFLDEGILHLGNQLHCDSRKEFHTTLDQCLLKGEVLADGKVFAADGRFHNLKTGMISHNGKCYLNLDDHEWKLKAGEAAGSYERIFISDSAPKGPVSNQTFLLVMPHREGDTKYCYAVLPDADSDTAQKFRKSPSFEVLENGKVQAIKYKEQIMAVFYEPSGLCTGTDRIAVDAPCMLIWKPNEEKLLVSSPDKSLEQLVVTVNSNNYRIKMPEDRRYRGRAIELTIE